MPFKSKAQRRKFAQLLVEGEITPEVYEEWNRETGGTRLPERVHKKSSAKSRPKRKRKSTSATARRRGSTGTRSRPGGSGKKRSGTRKRARS